MKKILILGSTGMLGSMVFNYLSKKREFDITTPLRKELPFVSFEGYDWIINCVGIIKQKLTNPEEAICINSLLPYEIARSKSPKTKVIQIATDCVFSGKRGRYTEKDEHDALDIYGKTKSLGEVKDKNFYNIRTSIIGFDKENKSLLSWFLSQKKGATIKGYTNHYWNGVTTLVFAKYCYGIIKGTIHNLGSFHLIPQDSVSKYELLKIFAQEFNREDINIQQSETDRVDRTLDTVTKHQVHMTIRGMVKELARYELQKIHKK